MFKKKSLPLSSTELKEASYLLNVFCAIMAVIILFSLSNIEGKLNTITTMVAANKQLN